MDIRIATPDDLETLQSLAENEDGYFERCFDEGRLIVIIRAGEVDCGYATLNFKPRYGLYQKLNYPEIQDVNVLPDYRRRGYATFMIHYLEAAAKEGGYKGIGISVGITASYGPAMQLYYKLGYQPDGQGVTCDRTGITPQHLYDPAELCLMMVKPLAV